MQDNPEEQNRDHMRLFKYRSLNGGNIKFVEKIFSSNELYFPSPLEFNDPYDSRPIFSLSRTSSELRKYLTDLYKKRSPLNRQERKKEINDIVKNRKSRLPGVTEEFHKSYFKDQVSNIGVYCMSAVPDHMLMWSHYADSHKGICLEFNGDFTHELGAAQVVKYSPDFPIIKVLKHTPDKSFELALLTKASYWGYEEEWRIVKPNKGKMAHRYKEGYLTGVILGAKISEPNKKRIIALCQKKEIPPKIYKAMLHDKKYKITIEELHT